MFSPEKIRNIAIIAHIDHGKTTMLDNLLKQSQIFRDEEQVPERVMDSYDQEKERGITIFSKHTSIAYNDFKINIIDTPGHADFSGEVERVLGMVNGVLLLVDAQEGPMPQTRFVLAKSLKMGLCPIVVLNKIDRPHADPDRVLNETFDLFAELGANDEQLDFSYCYASGLGGYALAHPDDEQVNMNPLFELITNAVPAPKGDMEKPLLMQTATISYDDFVGRQACGRIFQGVAKKGQQVVYVTPEGVETAGRIVRLENYHGLEKVQVEQAGVGDIVSVSGMENIMIGDAICEAGHPVTLPPIPIDEPTLSIDLMVNSSPFAGKDGKHLTMNKIRERLEKERRSNISLKIESSDAGQEKVKVSGRGELHLAVLIEAMRREGYELTVSKPQVIIKEVDGQKCEPMERVHIEVPQEFSGAVIEELSRRKGEMQSLGTDEYDITRCEFLIPTRGLMGYRNEFLTATKGLGILTAVFDSFAPYKGDIPGRKRGVMISMGPGQANSYACYNLQARGTMFVKPTDNVYEGMIVAENSRESDLVVNAIKGKQLTNVRASGKDDAIVLTPARVFTLEEAIDFIQDDEYVEVTPNFIRLRKAYLNENDRKRFSRKKG
ncbi:GTP-binding protein TypA/BipA homolog [Chlamydiales bacterium SCGC AG-110-M15]|nr:GTP-binding protein TypA/BipA homolog [Chlamydiales bacterium SCGC AG-110-M15]